MALHKENCADHDAIGNDIEHQIEHKQEEVERMPYIDKIQPSKTTQKTLLDG